jgi:hypothetical protein
MMTFVLRENVLTDNILMLNEENKVFKGGYIAVIKEYAFQSAWTDKETIKKFRNRKRLDDYLSKYYPEFEITD